MKKGVFSMIVAFVLGLTYLIFAYMEYPFAVVTKQFWFLSHSVNLPYLRIPGFLLIVTLAVLVNLFALISSSGSVAMGAGVLYAVAIGLAPECYPYVLVEFLLCVIAAARAERNHEAAEKELHAQSKLIRSVMKDPDNTAAYDVQSSSYEALRAQEEWEASRSGSRSRIIGIVIFAIILLILSALLPMLLQYNRSRKSKTVTKETISLSDGGNNRTQDSRTEDSSKDTPINLDGNWASESTSGTNMTASIEGDQISLYWRNADGSSSLYWAGTFITSLPSKEPFSCTAMMNVQEIATSPFASKDATKEFTYLDGKLSFQVTTMGIPVTFRLHRIDK